MSQPTKLTVCDIKKKPEKHDDVCAVASLQGRKDCNCSALSDNLLLVFVPAGASPHHPLFSDVAITDTQSKEVDSAATLHSVTLFQGWVLHKTPSMVALRPHTLPAMKWLHNIPYKTSDPAPDLALWLLKCPPWCPPTGACKQCTHPSSRKIEDVHTFHTKWVCALFNKK